MPLLARTVSWAFQKRSPGQLGVDGNVTVKKEKANLQLQEEVFRETFCVVNPSQYTLIKQ